MTAIIDYDTGNLRSVAEALRRAGAEFTVTADPATLLRAERVILPGVGEASSAMARLREKGLDTLVPALTCPVLGICIGMQLLCLVERGGRRRLSGHLPHATWCGFPTVRPTGRSKSPTWAGTPSICCAGRSSRESTRRPTSTTVHSYAPRLCDAAIAATDYGMRFSAALARDNFFGTPLHPKRAGRRAADLRNFLTLK